MGVEIPNIFQIFFIIQVPEDNLEIMGKVRKLWKRYLHIETS